MLIIAAIAAWFATQSPSTEPVAKPEPKVIVVPEPVGSSNQ